MNLTVQMNVFQRHGEATYNGAPAGGIAHFGSTISQSWEPPMHGQWAMNKILTESYSGVDGQPPVGHKTKEPLEV